MSNLYDQEYQPDFSDTAYWSNDTVRDYANLAEYLSEFRDADNGMNYVVNWLWTCNQEDDNGHPLWNGDTYYRDGTLHLLMIGQRKGTYHTHHIQVCRNDEPEVRKYLQQKYDYIKEIWQQVEPVEQI